MAALDRVLPPLIDPWTGVENPVVYTPQSNTDDVADSKLRRTKYGDSQTTDLLIRQYPPLFHAATNAAAFRQLLSSLTSLTHLTLSGPDNDYIARSDHRNISDYALVSLRAALEQVHMPYLTRLSMNNLYIGALEHVKPTKSSLDCWTRIESLDLRLYGAESRQGRPSSGQLQTVCGYFRCFRKVKRLHFNWVGHRGPMPTLQKPSDRQKAVRSAESQPYSHSMATEQHTDDITFPSLTHLSLFNISASASELSYLLQHHASTLRDFQLDTVSLSSGTWDEALAPLVNLTKTNGWRNRIQETWDLPIMLGSDIGATRPVAAPTRRQRHDKGIQMGTASLARSQVSAAQYETATCRRFPRSEPPHDQTRQSPAKPRDRYAVQQYKLELHLDKPIPPLKDNKRSLWGCKQAKKIFRGGLLKWP
ncbi:hypothetical protein MBLNU457_1478t2 [Dothideomycetes sp. NU457]